MTGSQIVHLILVSRAIGEPSALLIEREPGIVEFPSLSLTEEQARNEETIVASIRELTGLESSVTGFLDGTGEARAQPPRGQFLLARVAGGAPSLSIAHLSWEWRPLARLLALQFIPKQMANELRSSMYD
jgi:hypothetical protein